ncbi:MAG: tetratricopeptide repeat protein [Chloroflexi bacterium]|nr:tetratricopeptide repeat protein [Chloroflexota bacterium]
MTGNQDRFQQSLLQGHTAAWDQAWDRAAKSYQQALEEFPDHPKALTSLGLALLELKRYPEALAAYQHAADVLPGDPVPLDKIGQIYEQLWQNDACVQATLQAADFYLKKNDLDKAIQMWQRVTRVAPGQLLAHTRLAVTFERMGRKTEAVEEYLAVASLVQHSGDPAKAKQAVTYALQLEPENTAARQAQVRLQNGELLPQLGKGASDTPPGKRISAEPGSALDEAQAEMGGLDPVEEARQKALLVLANLILENSEEVVAGMPHRRDISAIMQGSHPASTDQADQARAFTYLSQAIAAQSQNQGDSAEMDLRRAVEAGFSHPAVYYDLGLLGVERGRRETALRDLQEAAKHPDYAMASHLLMGQTLQRMGRKMDAAVEYLEALRIADVQIVPSDRADELRQLYDPLIDALRMQPDEKSLSAVLENIPAQLLQPNWKETLQAARREMPEEPAGSPPFPLAEMVLQVRTNQVVASLATIRRLAAENLYRSAMEEAYYAVQTAPTYLPLHVQMGELLLQQGFVQEAVDKLTLVAHSYSLRGQPTQANSFLRRLIQLAPGDMDLRRKLIEYLESGGQTEDAIHAYQELAALYYSQADLDQALTTYRQALHLATQSSARTAASVEILARMADIGMQRLEWRDALQSYEQIRTLQPENEKARLNLVDLNLRLGQEKAALGELDSFMNYLVNQGKTQEALRFMKNAAEEHPGQIEIQKRLDKINATFVL